MHQTASSTDPSPPISIPVQRSHWWREVLVIAAFYGLYTLVRDLRGDRPVSQLQAFTNAKRIIRLERFFGTFHEQTVQHWFLNDRTLIRLCDDWYGTAHFVFVVVVLVLLFFKFPSRYRLWRNTLALTTGLALVGFYFFPLMPPRLLPPGYHFVDTLQGVRRVVELLVRRGQRRLQPVRGHAELAHRVVGVVCRRSDQPGPAVVGQGSRPAVPGVHHLLHHRDREPLLRRRRRRPSAARRVLRRGPVPYPHHGRHPHPPPAGSRIEPVRPGRRLVTVIPGPALPVAVSSVAPKVERRLEGLLDDEIARWAGVDPDLAAPLQSLRRHLLSGGKGSAPPSATGLT